MSHIFFFYSAVPDRVEISIKPLEPDLYSTTTAKPITNVKNAGKEICSLIFWTSGYGILVGFKILDEIQGKIVSSQCPFRYLCFCNFSTFETELNIMKEIVKIQLV